MSDRSVKKSEAAGRKKGSSSGSSKPNMHSIENSEPSSNPITLSTLAISLDTDKKIKTAPKAVLPEAVAQSTSVSNRKSMSTQNTLTEVANGKECTKESDYSQRTVNTQDLFRKREQQLRNGHLLHLAIIRLKIKATRQQLLSH